MKKVMKLGIGFATGRKAFRKVMSSYIYGWNEYIRKEHPDIEIHLTLFVAYDLSYSNTKSTDFTNLNQEIVDSFDEIIFIDEKSAKRTALDIENMSYLSEEDVKLIFSSGYAGKRNAILYSALIHDMDYLLFLDDDEYPVAVTNNHNRCLWSGQDILAAHLQNIEGVDITNGYHCGYISPIPQIDYNEVLPQSVFRQFIEAISNDVITWESIQEIMKNGGVTYGNTDVLTSSQAHKVIEKNHCKFITGSNLCINLTKPLRVLPFYNPPGARGEDTFLSTLLSDREIRKIPSYTFHDGFSAYNHLLDGVLPIHLESITAQSNQIMTRFYNACLGWVRYKPLLIYIVDQEHFEVHSKAIIQSLETSLPYLKAYFENDKFDCLLTEFKKYRNLAPRHYQKFLDTQVAWDKLMRTRIK